MSTAAALARLARELVTALAGLLPDYILKGLLAVLRWYLRLRLVPMFAATCALAVGVITATSAVGFPLQMRRAIGRDLGPSLVLVLLAVILLGVIRPGRREA